MIGKNMIARVELLSDVHIGTGTELKRDIDWIANGDFVYVANNDRLMEVIFDRAVAKKTPTEVANILASSTLKELRDDMYWLKKDDFNSVGEYGDLFRYKLRGQPATANIREQLKDVYGQPYLPGSTLKGSFRTVLAIAAAKKLKPNLGRLEGRRSWAAQPVERQLFGQDPNHDLLRALQVGDSQPVKIDRLGLRRAHIYPTAGKSYRGRSRGLDVDIETLVRGTVLELPIHITTELMNDRGLPMDERRHQELRHWERGASWLDKLALHGRNYARSVLMDEINFYQDRNDAPSAHRFFKDVVDMFGKLKSNEMILVIGWGGPTATKTLNQLLKQDRRNFDRIVSRYRLNPTGTHKPGDPFPKSRHLLRIGEKTGPPPGWVKVTLIEN